MQAIEQYIDTLFRHVLVTEEVIETKQEWKRHLLETVAELMQSGQSESDSLKLAIERFGDHGSVGELLDRFKQSDFARKTWMRADFNAAKIESSDMRGIVMRDVDLTGAEVFDSRLNGMRIHHGGMANLSLRHLDLDGLSIGFSQMNGAVIHDLGGHTTPIRFSENDFKRSTIDRCDLEGSEFVNCNLSGVSIKGSTLRDSWLLQPGDYKPLYMDDVNMRDSTIRNCDLSGVTIEGCQIEGLTINGIPIDKLLEVYERAQ